MLSLVGGGLATATLVPAAGAVPEPSGQVAADPRPVPVAATTLVCPDVRQSGEDLRTTVVAAVPPVDGGEGKGEVRSAAPGRPFGEPLLTAAGRAARLTRPDPGGPGSTPGAPSTAAGAPGAAPRPLLLGTRGPLAAGLVAEQVTRGETAGDRGWAAVRCAAPAASTWYAGASAAPGSTSELLLTNPGRTAALVDLALLGPSGRLTSPGATGIVVPPGGRALVGLDALLAGGGPAAVGVAVRGGQVASALRVRRVDASTAHGVDWLPAAAAPEDDLLLPGMPGGAATRTLVVANPGPDDVTVRASLVGSGGTAPVPGLRALPVPAGTTVSALLPAGGQPAALRVQSSGGHVVATVEVDEGDSATGIRDTGYAGAAEALGAYAVVGEVVAGPSTVTTLVLTAPVRASTVTVRALPVEGRPAPTVSPRVLEVPAGTTRSLSLSEFFGERPPGPVLLAVDGGPVWAGRVIREQGQRGPLLTLLDVRTPPATVPGVAVRAVPGLLGD